MGLLGLASACTLASASVACYAPELRDCTVTCNSADDCAEGHVCGSDQFCASPGIAGRCSAMPADAGFGDRDAGGRDAKMPDATTHVALSISIEGKGRVTVEGIGTCDESEPQDGECTFLVPIAMPLTASAVAHDDWRFHRWTTAACAEVPFRTCTFTPTTATDLGAKFRKEHD